MAVVIRPLTLSDLPALTMLDFSYVSDTELVLERAQHGLQESSWRLAERPLETPYDKGHGYDLGEDDLAAARRRLQASECLELVAEKEGRLAGLLEVQPEKWRRVGRVWNILVDRNHRRLGIGRQFLQHTVEWASGRGLKALVAETQTQNIHACRFYSAMGFVAAGVDDRYYRYCPSPQAALEVALFWYLELDTTKARLTGKVKHSHRVV